MIFTACIVTLLCLESKAQLDVTHQIPLEEVPASLVKIVTERLKVDDLSKVIVKISLRPDGRYRFFLDNVEMDTDLKQLAYEANGTLYMAAHRYDDSVDWPIELMISVQEKCSQSEVKRISKFEFDNYTLYQAVSGDSVYNFNAAYEFEKSKSLNMDEAKFLHEKEELK